MGRIVRAMTHGTSYRLLGGNGGSYLGSGAFMAGVTRHVVILGARYLRVMTIDTGAVGGGDVMIWCRLMLGNAMAGGTSAGGPSGDGRLNQRIRALMTGGAGGMSVFCVRYSGGMTVGAGQTANRRRDVMIRGGLMLGGAVTRGAGAGGLGGDGRLNQGIGALMTGGAGGVICFSVRYLSGMAIAAIQAADSRRDPVGRGGLVLRRAVAG